MQTVVNSLVVLSLLGMVLLLLAVAALLRDVRALQAAVAEFARPPLREIPAFADAGRNTVVLAVSRHCTACEDRARALAEVADTVTDRLVLLSADEATRAWVAGSTIETVVDPALVGAVGVDVTPLLLRYDEAGAELLRRPVGSDADLHRLLNIDQNRQAVT